ncbi:hypothetical protein L1987_80215 [Smallanthus sonchifolius]|uniref:Uncharacterized protein n=1 Tax=Smallanthus sonchifolius TaxID=185202 RepID=A0ACB8YMQ2_9ASTR|nr:hypothetical protein L1987_80215 [Smallanthus sonchifolius]
MKLQVFGYQDNAPNTEMSYPYFEIMRNQGKQKNRINSSNIFPLLMLCGIVDDACFLFAESAIQYSGKSSALTDTIRVVQDLKAQVDMLKKEILVHLAESPYASLGGPVHMPGPNRYIYTIGEAIVVEAGLEAIWDAKNSKSQVETGKTE